MNYYWFLKFSEAGLEKLRQIIDESELNEILKGEAKLNYPAFVTLFNIVGEDPNKFLGSGYASIVERREAVR